MQRGHVPVTWEKKKKAQDNHAVISPHIFPPGFVS